MVQRATGDAWAQQLARIEWYLSANIIRQYGSDLFSVLLLILYAFKSHIPSPILSVTRWSFPKKGKWLPFTLGEYIFVPVTI